MFNGEIVLQQLGGRRFTMMTGAKHFVQSKKESWISFRLPSRFAKDGINYVKIHLTVMDDYTLTFSKVWGTKVTEVAKVEGVYCDQLQSVFTEKTGLYTY